MQKSLPPPHPENATDIGKKAPGAATQLHRQWQPGKLNPQ